jgi:hypothetical protein
MRAYRNTQGPQRFHLSSLYTNEHEKRGERDVVCNRMEKRLSHTHISLSLSQLSIEDLFGVHFLEVIGLYLLLKAQPQQPRLEVVQFRRRCMMPHNVVSCVSRQSGSASSKTVACVRFLRSARAVRGAAASASASLCALAFL